MLGRFKSFPVLTLVLFAMVLCLEFNPFIPDNASGPLPRLAIVSLLMLFTMRGVKIACYVLAFLLVAASLFLVVITVVLLPGIGLIFSLFLWIPILILVSTAANLIFSKKLKRYLATLQEADPQIIDSLASQGKSSFWLKLKTINQKYQNKLSRNMKAVIALLICGIAITIFAISKNEKFNVSFGVLKDKNGYTLAGGETNTIEYIPKYEGYTFGFIITTKDETPFKYYTVSYLPASPGSLSGTLAEAAPNQFSSGIKSTEDTATNSVGIPFWFDEGDPLGAYKIDLYINDVKIKSVEFNVVPKR